MSPYAQRIATHPRRPRPQPWNGGRSSVGRASEFKSEDPEVDSAWRGRMRDSFFPVPPSQLLCADLFVPDPPPPPPPPLCPPPPPLSLSPPPPPLSLSLSGIIFQAAPGKSKAQRGQGTGIVKRDIYISFHNTSSLTSLSVCLRLSVTVAISFCLSVCVSVSFTRSLSLSLCFPFLQSTTSMFFKVWSKCSTIHVDIDNNFNIKL